MATSKKSGKSGGKPNILVIWGDHLVDQGEPARLLLLHQRRTFTVDDALRKMSEPTSGAG